MSEPAPGDELRALIALEKSALVDPSPVRARLAQRLASQLDGSATPTPKPPTPKAPRTWWRPNGWPQALSAGIAIFGAGVGAGAGLRGLWAPTVVEVRYVDRVVLPVDADRDAAAATAPVPSAEGPARSKSSDPNENDVAAPTIAPSAYARPDRSVAPAAASPSSVSPRANSDGELARELQVIDKARAALAHRDADAALAAIDEHARAFPRGQLVEMREALAVQALVHAGRGAEARARAARFHRAFPASAYSAVVDGAIASIL
jgi:hypothetical protein